MPVLTPLQLSVRHPRDPPLLFPFVNARKLVPLVLVLAGLWAWHNSFQGPFIFDDVASIPDNPHICQLWPIPRAMSAPPSCTVNGRPVVCLTLALNYALGGLNVWGCHAFNLAVHLSSAWLLFGILRRTLQDGRFRDRFGGAAIWLAAVIALLWEVHPLQTESVTYIVQRTELLVGLFLLLTLYCVLRGSRSVRPRGWYLSAVIACALGMGSKEVMVAAPLVVWLYDYVFLASSFRDLWQRRRGLYIGLAATWLILAVLVARKTHPMTGFGINGLSSWAYLRTEAGVIAYYLRLSFWPRPLVIDYFDWPVASSLRDCLAPGLLMIALLGATVWALRRRLAAGFWGAWFFLILAPTSSILPSVGEVAAERRMYLPLAAVVTMVVIGAFAIGKRLLNRRPGVALGCLAAVSVAVVLTGLTIQRNRDYRSALTIWQDTVAKRPNNPRALGSLGNALAELDDVAAALERFERALRIKPDDAELHYNLGLTLQRARRLPEAMEHYQQAVRLKPDYAEAYNNLGFGLQQTGNLPDAIADYQQAVRIKPEFVVARYNLGNALASSGRLAGSHHAVPGDVAAQPRSCRGAPQPGRGVVETGPVRCRRPAIPGGAAHSAGLRRGA